MIYAVANQKGGVGKTTTAVNLAACLAEAGARVLLVDVDPQANASGGLGVSGDDRATTADVLLDGLPVADAVVATAVPNLDIVPSSSDLAGAAVELPARAGRERLLAAALADARTRYGYVFLDCPPSLDLLTVNALAAADRVIVPVQCEYYALEGLSRLMETVSAVQETINPGLRVTGMLMTMHDARTRVSGDVIGEVRRHFPELAFRTVVPRNVRLAEAPSYGEPVIRYDPHCAGADAYFEAAKEVAAVAEAGRGRRGLGRGLSALLGEGGAAHPAAGLLELPVDAIGPNPSQPRARIDDDALAALAASIRASGVLQPVVVAPPDGEGRHVLVAGERRWRAARLAGLDRVPAVVRQVNDRERLELALVENLVREDLTPIDVAQACACLIEDFGQGHGELAERLGRSRPAVSNLVRLLELPEEVQEMIATGRLSEGHGRAILMADGRGRRLRVAEAAVAGGLSVRATEELARRASATPARARPAVGPVGDAALEAFGSHFDAPVRVRAAPGGQMVVELRFPDEEALEAALERLRSP